MSALVLGVRHKITIEQNFAIPSDQVTQFDIALEIQVQPEKVEVQEESATVGVSPSENASSIVIKGKDLEALSDDPDELQQELEALAGPSAGPNGGQIYIDGFTGGNLPPKESHSRDSHQSEFAELPNRRGVPYWTCIKSLLHQALERERKAS